MAHESQTDVPIPSGPGQDGRVEVERTDQPDSWKTRRSGTGNSAGISVVGARLMSIVESSPESRARRLVEDARVLTEQQVRDLSRQVTSLAGWFGTKRRWRRAWESVATTADTVGLISTVESLSNDSLIAVLEAAADAAQRKGRNVERLTAELQSFRSEPKHDDDVRRLRGLASKTLGIRAGQRIGPASLGVGGAAMALLTSEVPVAEQREASEARDLLLRPWQRAVGTP